MKDNELALMQSMVEMIDAFRDHLPEVERDKATTRIIEWLGSRYSTNELMHSGSLSQSYAFPLDIGEIRFQSRTDYKTDPDELVESARETIRLAAGETVSENENISFSHSDPNWRPE